MFVQNICFLCFSGMPVNYSYLKAKCMTTINNIFFYYLHKTSLQQATFTSHTYMADVKDSNKTKEKKKQSSNFLKWFSLECRENNSRLLCIIARSDWIKISRHFLNQSEVKAKSLTRIFSSFFH